MAAHNSALNTTTVYRAEASNCTDNAAGALASFETAVGFHRRGDRYLAASLSDTLHAPQFKSLASSCCLQGDSGAIQDRALQLAAKSSTTIAVIPSPPTTLVQGPPATFSLHAGTVASAENTDP